MDGSSGTGSVVTTFANNTVVSSSSTIIAGNGVTSNYTNGVLNPYSVNLTTSGSHTITVVSTTDPTAFGTASVIVTAGPPSKYLVTVSKNNPEPNETITITAQLVDAYNNPVSTSGQIVSWSSTNGGVFDSATSTTDANGIATISFTTANSITTQTVTAITNTFTGTSEVINVSGTLSYSDYENSLFKLYPNPLNQGYFFIEIDAVALSDTFTVDLFNLLGKKIASKNYNASSGRKLIDLPPNFSKGIYLIKISSGNHSTTKKVVIN
jgi:hypothetical protein